MSEAKFTEGEWWVNPIGPHWNNPEIASYEICWSKDAECVVDHVYELADAHLIAASPDMYAEIERDIADIKARLKFADKRTLPLNPDVKNLERKEKLLAKARGES